MGGIHGKEWACKESGRYHRRGYPLKPKKRLGQHFLRDRAIIQEMVTRCGFGQKDHVVEVGPGLGALTLPLAACVGHIVAIEKDPQLAKRLRGSLKKQGIHNVTLIISDILKVDLKDLMSQGDEKIKVIGNLPYNISSPFLDLLINNRDLMDRAVLMFQLEFAQRLIADPGTKAYGALSVFMQYHARISPLLSAPREAFYPKPKVGSMVVELDFSSPHAKRAEDENHFVRVVRGSFTHRRKTLLNSLKGVFSEYEREVILEALRRCGIDSGRRAETLGIDDFLCLSSALISTS
jgi:16S rRNA (adenine1518-N6/adenine1519-N6)-dimethyltransferase